LRTVRFWTGEVRRGQEDLRDQYSSRRQPLDSIDTQIMLMISKVPFESAQSIAQTLNILPNVMLHHLHKVRGLNSFYLRRVPRLLTDNIRLKRKLVAPERIIYFEVASRDGWHHFVTVDESCFFCTSLLSEYDVSLSVMFQQLSRGIFRPKVYVYDNVESSRVPSYQPTPE
jgi:hypothetical protein